MKYSNSFKVLSIQEISRKNLEGLKENEKTFLKLNLLDINNSPCSFMIFGDKKSYLMQLDLVPLEDVIITFDLNYSNNKWNVTFDNIDVR